ncbi:ATP-dependent DNA helicase DinG [Conchiformibius kuhniae]|uniref:ATP-dependent DNA helicase DinG n=1 Tax=Conchiformibius kuhniae TaxID=211502 RepID=A0ABD8B8I0_9NEIS|nr:ATP-dependent DNA helicase DinG [Conchiformibius kuhniae]
MLTDLEKNAIRDHYRQLGDNLSGFRPRAAQREMIAAVAQTFARSLPQPEEGDAPVREGESIAVIEGPTGVGKSLAYLLAGTIMAQTRGKRLIVSSATVALQEQLVGRDLPLLAEKSGLDFRFALAKGRGRYLCPYKLYRLTQNQGQADMFGFEALWEHKPAKSDLLLLEELASAFAERRFDGDRDTWARPIAEHVWQQVSNDNHGCLKSACPNRAECPFYLARDTLDGVDVIVANHDLLMVDIAMGGGVILPAPEHSFYCLDEAHHLPKKALSRFAAEHSWTNAVWLLEKWPQQTAKIVAMCGKDELATAADDAAIALAECMNEWEIRLRDIPQLADHADGRESVWLWQDGNIPENCALLVSNCFTASQTLFKHSQALREALSAARRDKDNDAGQIDRLSAEFGVFAARVEQMAAVWAHMAAERADQTEPPLAKWVGCRRENGKTDWTFYAAPISSAGYLANGLWRRAAGAVLTSATLRSLGNFDLLLQQTGLVWLPQTHTLALESPFDFAKQGELYVPPLLASPKDAAAHTAEIVEWLPKLISDTAAVGTLVLFASRRQMQDVALRLTDTLLPFLLVQGEQSKAALLAQHHHNLEQGKPSIIFGLDSFAEGLDLPGEACVQVIIAKLPFAMPDNPIEQTKNRWIEQRGGKPFMEITVPEAAIKLVQAVGRLIRTENDYGRITILDKRVITHGYGRQMLASLPPFRRIT